MLFDILNRVAADGKNESVVVLYDDNGENAREVKTFASEAGAKNWVNQIVNSQQIILLNGILADKALLRYGNAIGKAAVESAVLEKATRTNRSKLDKAEKAAVYEEVMAELDMADFIASLTPVGEKLDAIREFAYSKPAYSANLNNRDYSSRELARKFLCKITGTTPGIELEGIAAGSMAAAETFIKSTGLNIGVNTPLVQRKAAAAKVG